ncbi:hypothetical protein C8R42DRAFT_680519 [Lentinula raphanica]|nr:hypothetical protein C8R42DRAFT_680519 [Lentinula raphanica]
MKSIQSEMNHCNYVKPPSQCFFIVQLFSPILDSNGSLYVLAMTQRIGGSVERPFVVVVLGIINVLIGTVSPKRQVFVPQILQNVAVVAFQTLVEFDLSTFDPLVQLPFPFICL